MARPMTGRGDGPGQIPLLPPDMRDMVVVVGGNPPKRRVRLTYILPTPW